MHSRTFATFSAEIIIHDTNPSGFDRSDESGTTDSGESRLRCRIFQRLGPEENRIRGPAFVASVPERVSREIDASDSSAVQE